MSLPFETFLRYINTYSYYYYLIYIPLTKENILIIVNVVLNCFSTSEALHIGILPMDIATRNNNLLLKKKFFGRKNKSKIQSCQVIQPLRVQYSFARHTSQYITNRRLVKDIRVLLNGIRVLEEICSIYIYI